MANRRRDVSSTTTTAKGLPDNLAQRVQHLREALGWTQSRLAESAQMPLEQIQDIEAGLELFLAPMSRQKLARALKIRPTVLKAAEKEPKTPTKPALSMQARDMYIEEMLHHPNETYHCPACQTPLIVRQFNRRDLDDNLLVEVKAHCPSCLFKL